MEGKFVFLTHKSPLPCAEAPTKIFSIFCNRLGNNGLFVVRTSSDRLIDFNGEVARFDTMRTTRSICFIEGALPLANAVYWLEKGHPKPLFLLTNLDLGYEACHYYKRRFKIETLFKHLKSAGFYLHKTRLNALKNWQT